MAEKPHDSGNRPLRDRHEVESPLMPSETMVVTLAPRRGTREQPASRNSRQKMKSSA